MDSLGINGSGSSDNNGNAVKKNTDKSNELNFNTLQFESLFSISDDGDGKISITDIHGKKSKSVINLLMSYIEQGAEWTQDIINSIANAIKQLDKKSVEQEAELTETQGWYVVSEDKNSKKWVNNDGRIATEHYTAHAILSEYNTGEMHLTTFGETKKITDVSYDEKNNRITQWTDEGGVTTTDTLDQNGNSIRTYTKNGQPATASAKIFINQEKIENISSIAFNSNGYVLSYIVANGEISGEKVTDLRYDSWGTLISYRNSDGELVDPRFSNEGNGILYDETNHQGDVQTCYALSGLYAFSKSPNGKLKEFCKNLTSYDKASDTYTVNLPHHKPFQYKSSDLNEAVELSYGDKDLRAFEMAYRDLCNEKGVRFEQGNLFTFIQTITGASMNIDNYGYENGRKFDYYAGFTEWTQDQISNKTLKSLSGELKSGKYITTFAITSKDTSSIEVNDINGNQITIYCGHEYALTKIHKQDGEMVLTLSDPLDSNRTIEINSSETSGKGVSPIIYGIKTNALERVL